MTQMTQKERHSDFILSFYLFSLFTFLFLSFLREKKEDILRHCVTNARVARFAPRYPVTGPIGPIGPPIRATIPAP
jgi:hypothetical protein